MKSLEGNPFHVTFASDLYDLNNSNDDYDKQCDDNFSAYSIVTKTLIISSLRDWSGSKLV